MTSTTINQQLKDIDSNYAIWGRSELGELGNILMDDEQIMQAVNGYYDGGFALICVTNYRVLIVDKKPLTLTVEDLRYDMIAEVDFSSRLLTSVLHIFTPMRTLIFTSWSMGKLRKSMNYIQQRVMELRNNEFLAMQFALNQGGATPPNGYTQVPTQQVPQMVPKIRGQEHPLSEFDAYTKPTKVMNPYTKVPLLSRRRKYPSFY